MKRTTKYFFLDKHPELQVYMDDRVFLKKVHRVAKKDPSVSAAVVHVIGLLCNGVLQAFGEHLLTVSPLHDGMELHLEFEADGTPYVMVEEDVSCETASRN